MVGDSMPDSMQISQLDVQKKSAQISTKPSPIVWKWSRVGQIWSQIKKLIFLKIGDGRWWCVQVRFSSRGVECERSGVKFGLWGQKISSPEFLHTAFFSQMRAVCKNSGDEIFDPRDHISSQNVHI